ncbi:MAG TPA: carbamoyltransferase [Candidatus Hydrogenedens sp.]|nr:carbamoyltransferase [Candidatus Hydrogenedens sp.]HOK09760.1 carbamoyltransferase [Candidatus Hydrogenedens sp.]HOL19571.1 carbamoyltransferase [Candidatus Hydrogenedens sp.]HPP58194.1 carbamoyltransferase [Candidatus Hydrogenedens sp.]
MNILGISAFYHDSASALLMNGEIIASAQEERFTRKKHDPRFPKNAVEYCLREGNLKISDIDCVVFYDKPFLKFERLMMTYLGTAPAGITSFFVQLPSWLSEKLNMRATIRKELDYHGEILFSTHHLSHAASAFFPSPFEESAIITLDGVGEWATSAYGVGKGNKIKLFKEIRFPHSLGLLYSAFTYFTGFKVNSGEYKLMGLAPYGEPTYVDIIKRELIDIRDDGSFRLNLKYFDYCAGLKMTNQRFANLFGGPPRKPESKITQREMDLAKSIQLVTEEIVLKIAHHVHKQTGLKKLAMSGGVTLNCVANGRLLREGPFDEIWIQPCASDGGNALGCALLVWHQVYGKERIPDSRRQKASYLGPEFSDDEIETFLREENIPYEKLSEKDIANRVAQLIDEGKVVGWFQGRMEFGPRALGARSILGDARSREMQSVLNLKIKFRESFRPFAPTVLREHADEYFELNGAESPYMLLVANVRKEHLRELTEEEKQARGFDKLKVIRSDIPAVTHVDNSARIQTISRNDHPRYYDMIKAFYDRTGCPVIINTSFNVRGEPIVCTPKEAYTCFMRTNMDYLCMGSFLLDKTQQRAWHEEKDWKKEFELD